jgi:hypothetical protein
MIRAEQGSLRDLELFPMSNHISMAIPNLVFPLMLNPATHVCCGSAALQGVRGSATNLAC